MNLFYINSFISIKYSLSLPKVWRDLAENGRQEWRPTSRKCASLAWEKALLLYIESRLTSISEGEGNDPDACILGESAHLGNETSGRSTEKLGEFRFLSARQVGQMGEFACWKSCFVCANNCWKHLFL